MRYSKTMLKIENCYSGKSLMKFLNTTVMLFFFVFAGCMTSKIQDNTTGIYLYYKIGRFVSLVDLKVSESLPSKEVIEEKRNVFSDEDFFWGRYENRRDCYLVYKNRNSDTFTVFALNFKANLVFRFRPLSTIRTSIGYLILDCELHENKIDGVFVDSETVSKVQDALFECLYRRRIGE